MVVDVTMDNKICSLLYLSNATDTVLLNNVRKLGDLLLSRTSCSCSCSEKTSESEGALRSEQCNAVRNVRTVRMIALTLSTFSNCSVGTAAC
jgi:hypothetical protein